MKNASLLLPILMAACSSSGTSNSDLTTEDYDDTAQAVSNVAVGDNGGGGELAAMSATATIALGTIPLGFSLDAEGNIHGNQLGLDYTLSLSCEDAGGTSLPVCTALTDRADVDISWSGTLDTPNLDASVERHGSWTVDGLQSNRITFDGDSSLSYDATLISIFRPNAQSSFSFDASASYDGVVIDGQSHDAIDGSAAFSLDAHRVVTGTEHDVDESFSVDANVAFHADSTATLTLDGDRVYTLNLATGVVVRAN